MCVILIFEIISLLVIGFFAGVASGLLGIGGGIIFVPTLFFFLPLMGIPQSEIYFTAIATSLFAGSFSSSSAFFYHLRVRNIDFKKAFLAAGGSVLSAVTVPRFLVDFDPHILEYVLAVILFFIALKLLFENIDKKPSGVPLNNSYLIIFGVIAGIFSTIGGLGGGVFFVPILFYLFSVEMRRSIGTSSLIVAMTMISSTISFALIPRGGVSGNSHIGYVNLLAGILLGIGALLGAKYGVKFVFKWPIPLIKKIFALFLLIAISKMIIW